MAHFLEKVPQRCDGPLQLGAIQRQPIFHIFIGPGILKEFLLFLGEQPSPALFVKVVHIMNNQLIPRMVKHGFPVKGLRFAWDDAVDYTPEQQVAFEKMVSDRYEVDPKYFAEKYNMPVGERRNVQIPSDQKEDGDDGKRQKNAHPFFD